MLITDVHSISHLQVIEEASTKNNHRPKVRGLFQRADEANQNKRVYPKTILENQVKKLQPLIKERRLCGELDHPQNDTVKLTNASHLVTKLWMEGSEVMGEAEILNTPNGKVAQALITDGVKIGISSRGLGTLSEDHMTGQKTVNEDYNLVTFDLVADPSTRGAYPAISEGRILEEARYEQTLKEAVSERIYLTMLKNSLNEAQSKGASKPFGAGVPKKSKGKRRKWQIDSPEEEEASDKRGMRGSSAHSGPISYEKGPKATNPAQRRLLKSPSRASRSKGMGQDPREREQRELRDIEDHRDYIVARAMEYLQEGKTTAQKLRDYRGLKLRVPSPTSKTDVGMPWKPAHYPSREMPADDPNRSFSKELTDRQKKAGRKIKRKIVPKKGLELEERRDYIVARVMEYLAEKSGEGDWYEDPSLHAKKRKKMFGKKMDDPYAGADDPNRSEPEHMAAARRANYLGQQQSLMKHNKAADKARRSIRKAAARPSPTGPNAPRKKKGIAHFVKKIFRKKAANDSVEYLYTRSMERLSENELKNRVREIAEDAKKGYPKLGIKGGTKAAKKEAKKRGY